MESSLENGEFKLFLQPKYNVKHDKIDSAEALVRWFDPRKGEYMFPGEFIGLFETNGFIVKLDKFIYIEVLKHLSSSAERGDAIVPVSVNVSRVTAMSEDFLEFYTGNKKKYGIGDGFITLEFTESFAMENYDKITDIVNTLRENGMRSSIDDFGAGYSSFNLLKHIKMDEIKLDRLFLSKGDDQKRDDMIFEAVMNLAQSLDMKVVQEGVENEKMFNYVVSKGCQVIQGHYYAKAIPLEEYKIFINSNTSIKYKAKVK
jgi:EAL domain-containing protein (putative c-di-GMP-specific phosphodiesterase class I)